MKRVEIFPKKAGKRSRQAAGSSAVNYHPHRLCGFLSLADSLLPVYLTAVVIVATLAIFVPALSRESLFRWPNRLIANVLPSPSVSLTVPQFAASKSKPSALSAVIPKIANAEDAQKEAVRRYPELGIRGSRLNTEFLMRYKSYKVLKPKYFEDPSWPVRLAEEVSASIMGTSEHPNTKKLN